MPLVRLYAQTKCLKLHCHAVYKRQILRCQNVNKIIKKLFTVVSCQATNSKCAIFKIIHGVNNDLSQIFTRPVLMLRENLQDVL